MFEADRMPLDEVKKIKVYYFYKGGDRENTRFKLR